MLYVSSSFRHFVGKLGLFTILLENPVGQKLKLIERIKTPNRNSQGMCMLSYHRDRYKPKGLELEAKSKWNAFLSLDYISSSHMFSPDIFHLGRPNKSFHFHSNQNFQIFWVNGKQP